MLSSIVALLRARAAYGLCAALLLCSSTALAQDHSTEAVYAGYMRLYGGEREGSFTDFKALHARDPLALPSWFGMLMAHEISIALDDSLSASFEQGIAQFLDHADQRYSRSHADAEALFYLAQGYLLRSTYRIEHDKGVFGAARDAAKAKGYADTYIKAHPEHGDAYLALGLYNYYVDIAPNFIKVLRVLLFLPSGSRVDGLKQLERAAREGSLFGPLAGAALAEIYGALEGRPDEAIAIGERLVHRFPGNADMRLNLAQAYLHPIIESYDKAALQYSAVMDRASGPSAEHVQQRCRATLGFANLRRSQWRLEEAIAILTPVINQNVAKPVWVAPTFLLRRANYRALLNDPDAIADVRRVLADKTAGSYRKAADRQVAFIGGRRKTAEATIYALLIPGNRLVVEHRWEEARVVYDSVAAAHSGDWQVRYRRAYLEFARGNYDTAAKGFNEIVAASARMPSWLKATAMLNLAYTHDIAGRRADAVTVYKTIVDRYENEAASGAARVGLISPYRVNHSKSPNLQISKSPNPKSPNPKSPNLQI
jgi:tetratricopeptide (TPR) repeat protein